MLTNKFVTDASQHFTIVFVNINNLDAFRCITVFRKFRQRTKILQLSAFAGADWHSGHQNLHFALGLWLRKIVKWGGGALRKIVKWGEAKIHIFILTDRTNNQYQKGLMMLSINI